MDQPPRDIFSFVKNLRRRRVPRVVAAYLITGVAAVNVADVMSAVFELPDWTMKFVLTMLTVGFPITVALSWAFDITPEGVVRTPAEPEGPRFVPTTQHRRRIAVTVAMTVAALALGALTVARFKGRDRPFRPNQKVAVIPIFGQEFEEGNPLPDGVATLLSTRLSTKGWQTIDGRTMRGVVQLPGQPAQVARLVGAPMYVTARLDLVDDDAIVSASLFRADDPRTPLLTAEAEGRPDDVLRLIDLAAAQLTGQSLEAEGSRLAGPVAVLPAQIDGPEEYEYLSEGVPTLLATQLELAGWPASDIRSLFGAVAHFGGPVSNRSAGADAARLVGAKFLVETRVELVETTPDKGISWWPQRPPEVRIWTDLYHVSNTRRPIETVQVEGGIAEVPQLIGDVASRLLRVGNIDEEGSTSGALAPTGLLGALEAFVDGERQFREGRFLEAAGAFERAIEIDPEFALAYYRLGIAAEWISDISDYNEWERAGIDLALVNGARLTWRHRLLAEARQTSQDGDIAQAEQLYGWILKSYPNDYEANFQLAEILFHQAPLDGRSALGSEGNWQQVLTFEPDDFGALMHFARLLSLSGRLVELEAVAARALELSPDGERVLELDAIRAFATEDEDLIQRTLAALEETQSARTIWSIATRVALFTRELAGAERIAALLTEERRTTRARVLGHITLAHLRLAQGQWRGAQRELQAASSLDPLSGTVFDVSLSMAPFVPRRQRLQLEDRRGRLLELRAPAPSEGPVTELTVHDSVSSGLRLYALGLVSLELGSENDANYYTAQLEELGGSADAATLGKQLGLSLRTESYRVKGLLAAAARQWESFRVATATAKLELSPFFALTRERYVRAEILRDTGREDEALQWFSSFSGLSVYDLAYLGPAHLQRGRLLESRSEYASAAAEYQRLVELWPDPDPELLPMVELARERLRSLAALDD